MNKLRYPEKKYLCSYDLSAEFFDDLGLEVTDITPLRKVFVLQTNEGKKILKKIDYGKDRIEFINECVKKIYKKLPNVISFKEFGDGKIYKVWNEDYYIIMNLIEGREVAFTNVIEVKMSAELIAKMHIAARDSLDDICKSLNKNINELKEESLVVRFDNCLNDLKYIKGLVSSYKYKNEFDNLFLSSVDEHIIEVEKALELLSFSGYSTFREELNNLTVCHNDLAEHNFIIKNEEINLIDFDYCTIDLRVVDIADFVLKSVKNVAFDIEKAQEAISSYDAIYPLSKEEFKMLYIILLYPRDFYSIVRGYYHKQKDWEEEVFVNRLKGKLLNEDFRREFLLKYKAIYREKFI